jgi:hypothetical protein
MATGRSLDDFPAFIVGRQLRRSYIRLHIIHIECICNSRVILPKSQRVAENFNAKGSAGLRSWGQTPHRFRHLYAKCR